MFPMPGTRQARIGRGAPNGRPVNLRAAMLAGASVAVILDVAAVDIAADLVAAADMTIDLEVVPDIASNDNFADRVVMTVNSTYVGDNTGYTLETFETDNAGSLLGDPVTGTAWFEFTPGSSGTYTFHTIGSTFDSVVGYGTASSGTPTIEDLDLPFIEVNDEGGDGITPQSKLTVSLTAATKYYIAVGGYSGSEGTLSLTVASGDTTDTFP